MPAKIHGRLAAARPTVTFGGGLNHLFYQVPASRKATVTIAACNFSGNSRPIRLAVLPSGSSTVTSSDWIEYGTSISVAGVFERSGITLSAGQSIRINSDDQDVAWSLFGIEEDA